MLDMDAQVQALLEDVGIETDNPAERVLTDLAAHVRRCWQAAVMAKADVEDELLRCLRQRNNEYDPEILELVREQGGNEIYMGLTQVKCRATESWITEILRPPGEVPFGVEPTPKPDVEAKVHQRVYDSVQAEVMEAMQLGIEVDPAKIEERLESLDQQVLENLQRFAAERAEEMEEHIADIVQEGGWYEALDEFISDFVTYPAAFLKGPVRIRKKRMNWAEDEFGQAHPAVQSEVVRTYNRVSPFDMFPSPDSKNLQDGYIIERIRYRRKQIYDLIGVPGYDEEALRDVLHEYGDSGHKIDMHSERDRLEGREESNTDISIEALSFWGEVRGRWLLDWGLGADLVPDPDDDYEANVIMIGEHIIRAALNPHPLGRRPYYCASFEGAPGSIWRKGLCQLIRDIQNMCNAAARALANNMALSSGPMMDVQIDRLAEGEPIPTVAPFSTIQTVESKTGASGRPAVTFFQPGSNAGELMRVYDFFSTLADEYSGIPPYAQGVNTSSGAAGTATGLAMLQDNAARGVKRAVKHIDTVIVGSIKATFEDVMLYDNIRKGDIRVVAKASTAMINRERQTAHMNELLMSTANPIDQQIIGVEGRRKMLEDAIQARGIDPTDIIPSKDKVEMMLAQQAQQQAQQQALAPPESVMGEAGMRPPNGP